MKTALILGGAGFIGMALTRRLKADGLWVRAIDIRHPPFEESAAEFAIHDLREEALPGWPKAPGRQPFDFVVQLASDLGGAGYLFTGRNDADVMANNVRINANVARALSAFSAERSRLLYASSSCVYDDAFGDEPALIRESDAGRSSPSSSYGWEKLFSEKLYQAHADRYGLDVCTARFSTIYGPGCAFDDGREMAVAAICRKVIDAPNGGEVEVWGDGEQIRPLVYIDDLVEAIVRLLQSKTFNGPVNIANSEFTTCNEIARKAIALSNKRLTIKNVPGPIGKQALAMTTDLAKQKLGWTASTPFDVGLERTFAWIAEQKAKRLAA